MIRMKYSLFQNTLLLPLAFFAGTLFAYAGSDSPTYFKNPVKYGDIKTVQDFLLALVDLIFLLAVPLIVVCIIYSGFLFVTAGDNESQVSKARTVFVWTIVGAGVLLGAKAIAMAIQATIESL
jgi:hypothetical protein